tara:strand:+ start:582 stop:950 length:369 start_codon:yes stop_codon:yes gene_type:complete
MANSKQHRYPNSFKHEVCQYYTHHTGVETQAKYGVDRRSIGRWRVVLGYNNKHRSRHMYAEAMQPALKKREQREWMVTKKDNAFLLDELTNLRVKLMNKDMDNLWLKGKLMDIADAIKTMED